MDEYGDDIDSDLRGKRLNKENSKRTLGASPFALQEAHDIFGNPEGLLRKRENVLATRERAGKTGVQPQKRLEDEHEPMILFEKYMIPKDDQIREVDIPERMQISEEGTPMDERSIEDEGAWIYNQIISMLPPLVGQRDLTTIADKDEQPSGKDDMVNIKRFLELTHVHKLDVLWVIQDLYKKWLLLQKRRAALSSYYIKRYDEESQRIYDETRLCLNRQLFESIAKSLKVVVSEIEIDDVDTKFNLHFPPGEVEVDERIYKRPKRKSQHTICSKAWLVGGRNQVWLLYFLATWFAIIFEKKR